MVFGVKIRRWLKVRSETSSRPGLKVLMGFKSGWIMCLSILFLLLIMRCWSVLSPKRKSKRLFGILKARKSLGPDGFNFGLIKFCWEFIRDDILLAVNDFARVGKWPRGTNASFVCLVPKLENPQSLCDFRPISLVRCLYKIISKLLSLRLKKVMSKIIDSRQSAFLAGRGILDSVLVANEVLEEAKRRKKNCLFFQVDYEKAYDSVRWDFISYMLERLGFCEQWIAWIKSCLESATVFVLVNDSPTKEFVPSKGLRQGDLLAPFLFLIVAEG